VTVHPVLTGILLGVSVVVCMMCALGVLVMRNGYQRLNYPASAAWVSGVLMTVAVFAEDGDAGTRIKVVMIAVVLIFTNGVMGHATGRAMWIREKGRWPVKGEDRAAVEKRGREAGHD
jgi:multisubunit Na+/H+ antiporter MnhG subunit